MAGAKSACLNSNVNSLDLVSRNSAVQLSISYFFMLINIAAYVPRPVISRKTNKTSTESTLFGITLYTHTTIRGCLNFWRQGTPINSSDGADSSPADSSHLPLLTENEFTMLVSLGPHMNGHPGILHSGVAVMLMDEAMDYSEIAESGLEDGLGSEKFIRTLQVTSSAPIPIPGVVRVRVWKDMTELGPGQKWGESHNFWSKACVEDGKGRILVDGRYLFTKAK